MNFRLLLLFGLPSADNLGDFAMRALAVVGGAFGGGFLVGLLTQLLSRGLTTRPVPPSALRFIRVLGGIVCGVLVAMVMFGSGGGGFGFGGGGGQGTDKGNGDLSATKDNNAKDQVVQDKPPPKDAEPPPKKTTVRIEVLSVPSEVGRRYRVEGEANLQSLKDLGDLLPRRRKQNPDLEKVVIVLYKNSPDRDTVVVRDLVEQVKLHQLTPSISLEPGPAP